MRVLRRLLGLRSPSRELSTWGAAEIERLRVELTDYAKAVEL